MSKLELTHQLRGDLGELYFKHLCYQRGYAFIKLESIYKTLTPRNELEFRFKYKRIPIQIPDSLVDEIRRVCRPEDVRDSPSYVFDFLTCKIDEGYSTKEVNQMNESAFNWVEVKTGSRNLTPRQDQMRRTCKIRFNVFRVRDIMVSPDTVLISYDGRS
jgi:hypothetical protein